MRSWGIICTTNAPTREVLNFCAHHLEIGAHRIYIYLDGEDEATFNALKSHGKIRPVTCDAAWWEKRKGRPEKHQVRQVLNARHACNRRADVDWLTHIDVDEFLLPSRPLGAQLEEMPVTALCGRIRPIEALAPAGEAEKTISFKAMHTDLEKRLEATDRVFPTFGPYLSGGFLSHVAGKVIFRTGIGMKVKIHNCFLDDAENPGEVEMTETDLAHLHAESWEDWRARFDYRLARGSYRPELGPPPGRRKGGINLHVLLRELHETEGDAGLKRFYEETCLATPALTRRLEAEGLLRRVDLDLDAKRARHFPGHA